MIICQHVERNLRIGFDCAHNRQKTNWLRPTRNSYYKRRRGKRFKWFLSIDPAIAKCENSDPIKGKSHAMVIANGYTHCNTDDV